MNAAAKMDALLKGAREPGFGRTKFNMIMKRVIPFNAPHGIRLTHLDGEGATCELPYKRRNFNHLKGMHACAMATVAEFTSGIFLLNKVGSASYRLIMRSLRVDYHYQAKHTVISTIHMEDQEFQDSVMNPLGAEGVCFHTFQVELHDTEKNHIATAYIDWQLKAWAKTKTAL